MKRAENCVDAKINHIRFENDCLVFEFAKSKSLPDGEDHVGPWHVYANPHEPHMCPVLALAKYLFTNVGILSGKSPLFEGESQYSRYIIQTSATTRKKITRKPPHQRKKRPTQEQINKQIAKEMNVQQLQPTKKLNKSGNLFFSTKCEELSCSACLHAGGIPTRHRCMQRVFSGGYYNGEDSSDIICGIAFCLLCGNERGLEEGTYRCAIHQVDNNEEQLHDV